MKRVIAISLLLGAIALGALAPTALAANSPGTGPDTAISISGTMQGTLAPLQTRWYQFAGDGSTPMSVTMDYVPNNNISSSTVFFNVDWTTGSGVQNIDWPGYFRVGQGTSSGLSSGQVYWLTSPSAQATYDIEVVNNATVPVGYALALTGTAFPPAWLNPPGPGASVSLSAPAATPVPLPTATPPPSAVTPGPTANSATDRSGLILDPQVTIDGPFSTVSLHVDSSTPNSINVYRVMLRPPDGAVVDGAGPTQSLEEDGITWYTQQLVNQGNPMSGYYMRFYGSANGAVAEIDWSTTNDKGALTVTISGAPNPAPPGT